MRTERLTEINQDNYLISHQFNQEDYDKIHLTLDLLSYHHSFNDSPKTGDLVEGAVYDTYPYRYGRIESVEKDMVTICCNPYTPFVSFNEKGEPHLNISGGPFITCTMHELEFVKDDMAQYKFWGHAGACANGAINVETYVKRWRLPYELKPQSYITEIDEVNTALNPRLDAKVILHKDYMWFFARYSSMNQLKALADLMGFTFTLDEKESKPGYRRYSLSHQLTEGPGFWNLSSLHKDAKPFIGASNGRLCTCYFTRDDKNKEIKIYRPNPNSRQVYDAMDTASHIRYKAEYGDAGPTIQNK
jgi:hypothetical protein